MKGKVQMWGNSLAIRIPRAFANEIHLTSNSAVEISLKNGVLQVEPVLKEVDIEKLLERVTENNLHELVDFGMPRGKEVW
ncbi:MAG: AbrB/MazE/SpoVT family DNA-binding domain-containing protein [Candidatus Rifleibacteriota bacterium]